MKTHSDSAHDAYAVYEYCRRENITPFIDLNPSHTGHFIYKDDSPLMRTASRSVRWAYVCTKMDMGLPSIGRNTGLQKQTENAAVSVSSSVHRRNMEGPYMSLPMTIQGYLTYRQGTAKHEKRNRNALTRLESHSLKFREVIFPYFV